MQDEAIRAGDVFDAAILHPRDPGDGGAVIETDAEFGLHGDIAVQAGDTAKQVARARAARHEIGDADGAVGGLESCLED